MAHGGDVLSDTTNMYYLDPLRHNHIYLYPQYINAKRTKQQGRRTSKANSIENPTAQEIRDVCQAYDFETVLQPRKRFPQDPDMDPMHIGRVRIKLKNSDGSPCNPEYDTKLKVIYVIIRLSFDQDSRNIFRPPKMTKNVKLNFV